MGLIDGYNPLGGGKFLRKTAKDARLREAKVFEPRPS